MKYIHFESHTLWHCTLPISTFIFFVGYTLETQNTKRKWIFCIQDLITLLKKDSMDPDSSENKSQSHVCNVDTIGLLFLPYYYLTNYRFPSSIGDKPWTRIHDIKLHLITHWPYIDLEPKLRIYINQHASSYVHKTKQCKLGPVPRWHAWDTIWNQTGEKDAWTLKSSWFSTNK